MIGSMYIRRVAKFVDIINVHYYVDLYCLEIWNMTLDHSELIMLVAICALHVFCTNDIFKTPDFYFLGVFSIT